MFNSVVNPFIGRSTSSQHLPFDYVSSSSFSPHHYQLLHVIMTNQSSSSSSFYEYDPFNQTSNGDNSFSYIIEAEKPLLDNNSDGSQRERSTNNNNNHHHHHHHHHHRNQWSSDEAVALLKVRSSLENSAFPDLTWEHVSRKHAHELGYRSADLWKQKFEEEEENKHLNSTAAVTISNQQEPVHNLEPGISQRLVEDKQLNERLLQHKNNTSGRIEEISAEAAEAANTHHLREVSEEVVKESSNTNKRKRRREEDVFEMLKRCCDAVANKMMAQQEELHKKLIDDITKRDEQEIAREEARRNQELARVREEIETRAHERAEAEKRQAIIVGFLKKFTTCHGDEEQIVNHLSTSQDSVEDEEEETVLTELQNPNSQSTRRNDHTTDTTKTASEDRRTGLSLSPLLPKSLESEANMIIESTEKGSEDHIGKKRWPRDEVLALISLRCKMMSNNNSDHVGGKGHLWERISRGMLEMGYKRNAKRCKEKWENINKYFRRTRESKKKRSVDSRTCPYFHQLSCLYSEGTRCIAPESGMC